MAEPRTRAARPPRPGGAPQDGGGAKIMGLEPRTFWIVAAVAVVGGYLYIKSHSSTPPAGQGGGGGKGGHHSPTGLKREHLTIWVRDHGGHHGRK